MPAMRLGFTVPSEGVPLAEHAALAAECAALGYTDCWSLEVSSSDAFVPLAVAAAGSDRLRYGTAVASVFARGPALLATNAWQLAELAPGRFALGIGTSSDVIVERWNGVPFEKPYTRLADTLSFLRAALAGERAGGGFKLPAAPALPVPILLGALRPRALRLAGSHADGVALNLVPAASLGHVLEQVHAGAREAGRDPASLEVVQRVLIALGPPEVAERLARRWVIAYAQVEVYRQFFHSVGLGDAVEPAIAAFREGRRDEAVELLPADLVRSCVLWGSRDEIRAGLAAHAAAGVTTAALYFMVAPGEAAEQAALQREALRSLAPGAA